MHVVAEGFPIGGDLNIGTHVKDHLTNIRVYDSDERLLLLDARVTRHAHGSIQVRAALLNLTHSHERTAHNSCLFGGRNFREVLVRQPHRSTDCIQASRDQRTVCWTV